MADLREIGSLDHKNFGALDPQFLALYPQFGIMQQKIVTMNDTHYEYYCFVESIETLENWKFACTLSNACIGGAVVGRWTRDPKVAGLTPGQGR